MGAALGRYCRCSESSEWRVMSGAKEAQPWSTAKCWKALWLKASVLTFFPASELVTIVCKSQ